MKTIQLPSRICPKCGAEYAVTAVKQLFRDTGTVECRCGHELLAYSEWRSYQFTLVADAPHGS